jgi:hypothetical protein
MFSWRCFPFVDSTPRAYRLKASNAAPLISTLAGTFPWFEKLAEFVGNEPIRARDKVMIGMLSLLGIEKGKPFNPDTKTRDLLNAAIKDAYAIMQAAWVTPGQSLTAWWTDRQWMNANPEILKIMGHGWSFETQDAVYSYVRSMPFFFACYLPEKLGGEQLYLIGLRDAKGRMLSGKNSYRLRVPADVPVDKFWSIIVYSQRTKGFVSNVNPVGLSSYDKLKLNTDSSVDIYLGNAAPTGYEGNWLPAAGEDFFLFFRLYGPAKSVYEKTWKLPDIERL